ncbi:MAG: hypothetical protein OH363_05005 [Candidatus Parvarchaeota archaeon]|nr:hypothetical protein [Candidatus Jingweiarchaeum tengchongense]
MSRGQTNQENPVISVKLSKTAMNKLTNYAESHNMSISDALENLINLTINKK